MHRKTHEKKKRICKSEISFEDAENALTFSSIRYASRRVVTNVHARRHFFINDRTWTVTSSVNGFQPFGAFAITTWLDVAAGIMLSR